MGISNDVRETKGFSSLKRDENGIMGLITGKGARVFLIRKWNIGWLWL